MEHIKKYWWIYLIILIIIFIPIYPISTCGGPSRNKTNLIGFIRTFFNKCDPNLIY